MAKPRYVPFSDQRDQRGRYVFRWISEDPVGSVFDLDCDLERHGESKREALRATPEAVWSDSREFVGAVRTAVRDALLEQLPSEHPLRAGRGRGAALSLDELVAALPCDVAVVSLRDAMDRLVYLNVLRPSGWDPDALRGANFAKLHRAVPIAKPHLREGAVRLRAIHAAGEPALRFTWGLQTDDALDAHPLRRPPRAFDPERGLWLRVERQVFVPVRETDCLIFAIQPYVEPVSALSVGQTRDLLEALRGMTPADREYKGIANDFDAIIALLSASIAGAAAPRS